MDVAEVLATIVERACVYVPEASGANVKKPKRLTEESEYPKEALSAVDKASPIEALTSVGKVSVVASNLVRIKSY